MKVFFKNENTCTRVKLYGEDVKNNFKENNYEIVNDIKNADLIIVNTCSFLKAKEDYFINVLKKINEEKRNDQKLMVIGCLASVNKERIMEINSKIICYGRNLSEIKKDFKLEINPKISVSSVCDKLPFKKKIFFLINKLFLHSDHIEYRLKRNNVCYLQISTGCKGNCSYCSEKFTTQLKSRSIAEIIESIKDGISRGYKLFALNSDDASAYGLDKSECIGELLERVIALPFDFKITIPEFNPQGITDNVKELLKNKKVLYITVPIQSGSQKILNSMRRPYIIDEVIDKLKDIKKSNKTIKVNTHVIVGFPGELDEDFEFTKNLLKTGIFDRVKIFKYSERPNTEAITLPNKIPEDIKQKRYNQLIKLVKRNNIKHFSLTNLILNLEQVK